MTEAEIVDIVVALFLVLLALVIVAVVILAKKNRPPQDEEPVIESLNTLADMPIKQPERSIWDTANYKTTIHCPRCKAYLGESARDMRHWCESCRIYIAPPKQ